MTNGFFYLSLWTGPFLVYGCHISFGFTYLSLKIEYLRQTVQPLIRRHLWRLIWGLHCLPMPPLWVSRHEWVNPLATSWCVVVIRNMCPRICRKTSQTLCLECLSRNMQNVCWTHTQTERLRQACTYAQSGKSCRLVRACAVRTYHVSSTRRTLYLDYTDS